MPENTYQTTTLRTPHATCSAGQEHVSWYEAQRCERALPEPPTSYDVPLGWHGTGRRS